MTQIVINVADDKKLNLEVKGENLHPVDVCKILSELLRQILGTFVVPEQSKIIKPKLEVIK
jgi:hypothetical protein